MSNNKTANTDAAELVDDVLRHAIYELLAIRSNKLSQPNRRIIDSFNVDDSFADSVIELFHQQQQKAVRETLERLLNSRQVIPRHSGTDSFYPSNYIEVVQVENIKQELNRLDNQQSDKGDSA